MRILLASGEIHPFSKTGGLADMVAALAKSLAQAGHQVGIVTPLYRGIRERLHHLEPSDQALDLDLGPNTVSAALWKHMTKDGLAVYFVDQPEFYQRAELYQENGVAYPDNAERFAFLCLAVAHLARHLPWQPEMVHVHDWHVGFVPLLIKHQAAQGGWQGAPPTCLTIHNLAYQGDFPPDRFGLFNLPWRYFTPAGAEFYGQVSFLKTAIVYADAITTVSPRYAAEIVTPALGCGLDGVLRSRQNVLTGILNGVDYEEWRTHKNPHLPHPYSLNDLEGKLRNKLDLQTELGLPVRADVPLFGSVTRLTPQKGMDILLGALEELMAEDIQFALLGSGGPDFQEAFKQLALRFPAKAAAHIGYDHGLSHRIEAGADFFLMPSFFEPCGLNQMYSLHYGTVPIVRATGGLEDSVIDLREAVDRANGIKFHDYSVPALAKAMRKALVLFAEQDLLRRVRANAMSANFAWGGVTQKYVEVYERALSTTGKGNDVTLPQPAVA